MTRAPSTQPDPTRRWLLGVGLTGLATGLTGCHRSSKRNGRATADADAQHRTVDQVAGALAAATALAGHRSTTAAIREAARDLATGLRAQLRLLGGRPSSAAAGRPSAARVVSAARTAAKGALASVAGTSGPMARLLTCVAAGVLVRTQALAVAAKQPALKIPHATSLPPLDNDDLLPRITARPPVLGQPVSDSTAAAWSALSEALRTAEYGYGLAAARSQGATRTAALRRMGSHRRAALALDSLAGSVSRTMPAAQLAYPVSPPTGSGPVRTLARRLELDVAFAGSRVVADLDGDAATARGLFADHLVSTALAASRWGVLPALPGMSPA